MSIAIYPDLELQPAVCYKAKFRQNNPSSLCTHFNLPIRHVRRAKGKKIRACCCQKMSKCLEEGSQWSYSCYIITFWTKTAVLSSPESNLSLFCSRVVFVPFKGARNLTLHPLVRTCGRAAYQGKGKDPHTGKATASVCTDTYEIQHYIESFVLVKSWNQTTNLLW